MISAWMDGLHYTSMSLIGHLASILLFFAGSIAAWYKSNLDAKNSTEAVAWKFISMLFGLLCFAGLVIY